MAVHPSPGQTASRHPAKGRVLAGVSHGGHVLDAEAAAKASPELLAQPQITTAAAAGVPTIESSTPFDYMFGQLAQSWPAAHLPTDDPATFEISEISGEPLLVSHEAGILTITYADLTRDGLLERLRPIQLGSYRGLPRRSATINLRIPRDCPVEVTAAFNGLRRMTLTASVVNGARTRVVLARGAVKRPIIERWLDGATDLPVGAVRRSGTMVYLDESAAPRSSLP